MIDITTSNLTGMFQYVGEIFENFKPLFILTIGLPLGFWVINKVIDLVNVDKKYYIWGRKIDEQVGIYKDQNASEDTIRKYLQKCRDLREKNLDPKNLTDYEKRYSSIVQKHFDDFGIE